MRFIFSIFCLSTLIGNSKAQENWPQFRGPSGDGHAESKNLPLTWSEKENIRWKTPIHDKGWSSPVIWGNQIWLTTAHEKYAANAPKENAQRKVPRPEFVEFYAVCIDRKSGKILHDLIVFKEENPDYCHSFNSYATPTPVVEAGRVFVHFGAHGTACLDTTTGKKLWEQRDLKCDHWRGPGSSPIADDKALFLTFDGYDQQYVAALDKNTGKILWKKDRLIKYTSNNGDLKKAYSTPTLVTIDGKPQLISPAAEATIAYDPANGNELWRITTGGMNQAAKPIVGHGLIYLTTGHSQGMIAMKEGSGGQIPSSQIAWKMIKNVPTRPSFLLQEDYIYMVSDNGFASCVNAKTGSQVWVERFNASFSASPIIAHNTIYIPDQEGTTQVFAATPEFKSLAKNKLDSGCMASPAVAGEAIFLRTKTHLYCIEKKS